jgi:hypothetical protein
MLRQIAIGLAAAAIAVGGSTLSAQAGGGKSGGGGPHGSYGGRVGGFGPHGGGGYRHDHWRGERYGYRHYRPYYRYSSGGSCWRWTPEGRTWVCGGGYGPSYRYGYYREGWRGRYGRGPHGGGRHFR